VLFLCASTCAFANGAPYEPHTSGGLVYLNNKDIRIAVEELRISHDLITVDYTFVNSARRSIAVEMAFPMPLWVTEGPDAGPEDSEFKVSVNNQTHMPTTELVVWYGQPAQDVTSLFKEANVSPRVEIAPDSLREKLEEIPNENCNDRNSGPSPCTWVVQNVAKWHQDFPSGTTNIHITYKPSVGGDYYFRKASPDRKSLLDRQNPNGFGIGNFYLRTIDRDKTGKHVAHPYRPSDKWIMRHKFCVDPPFENALNKRLEADELSSTGYAFNYVLETGRHWNGPIGRFRLVVEKKYPTDLVSFCPAGAKKISPTEFEWKAANFEPRGEISVLFVTDKPGE
jgi:hypothetical protein